MLMKIAGGGARAEIKTSVYVSITTDALCALKEYVAHYKGEVSGCGMVERIEHRDEDKALEFVEFCITEVFLPHEQDNSAASTEIDEDMVHEMMTELIKQGKNTENLRLHWHSHATMDVFHSGTDEENYEELDNGKFLASLVMNHAGDMLASVHIYGDLCIDIKDVPVYTEVELEMSKDVKERVTEDMAKLDKHIASKPVVQYHYRDDDYSTKWANKISGVDQFPGDVDDITDAAYNAKFERCDTMNCHVCKDTQACAAYYSTRHMY